MENLGDVFILVARPEPRCPKPHRQVQRGKDWGRKTQGAGIAGGEEGDNMFKELSGEAGENVLLRREIRDYQARVRGVMFEVGMVTDGLVKTRDVQGIRSEVWRNGGKAGKTTRQAQDAAISLELRGSSIGMAPIDHAVPLDGD